MRSALQCMRKRPRRWIALLALFALLFNQIALARHLCLYRPGEISRVAAGIDPVGGTSGCHGDAAEKPGLIDSDITACAAHCDDADKQTRDVPALKVPDLFGPRTEIAGLRLTRAGPVPVRVAGIPRHAIARRTVDYGVMLI